MIEGFPFIARRSCLPPPFSLLNVEGKIFFSTEGRVLHFDVLADLFLFRKYAIPGVIKSPFFIPMFNGRPSPSNGDIRTINPIFIL